jgi:hypothetical protein
MFKGKLTILKNIYSFAQLNFFIVLITLSLALPSFANNTKDISLKQYSFLSLPVPNPLDISRLPLGKNYQIKHDHFILQFYFFFQHIRGIIVKRDMKYPIHLRWCFFRSCEEHPLDFVSVIAQPHQPPVGDEFFWVRFPPQIKYSFQGLEFTTGR